MRQSRRGDDRRVLDAYAMMHFVALFQAAQDGDGVFDIRLTNEDNLETAFQRRIFLNVLAVLVQRGRANCAQLAASKRRLKHVGSVHRTLGRARANQRMQLVDEQDDLPRGIFNFFQHGLQAILKLAAVFCARQHGAQIQSHYTLVLQPFGYVAGNDALCQTFHNGGLAHAGLSDQHRIVLGTPGEDLNHAADLFVAADYGIQLAATSLLGQVTGIALERLILFLGILIRYLLRSPHRGERLQDRIVGCAMTCQDFLCWIALELRCCQQQVLGRDILVLEVAGFFESLVQQLIQGIGGRWLGRTARDFWQGLDYAVGIVQDGLRTNPYLLEHRRNDAFLVLD